MNILDLDLKSAINYSIDAYTHIYGEEYRNIIKEKINNAIIIPYCDPDDLIEYIKNLKECKCRGLSIKYLRTLGIETNIDNYSEPFSIELNAKIGTLIGPAEYAFRKSYTNQENIEIYLKLHNEYLNFEDKLKEYKTYINRELKRKKEIEKCILDYIFKEIESSLPNVVKEKLKEKSLDEKERILLGRLSEPFIVEYFSTENMNKLFRDKNIMVLSNQLIYFRNLGIKIDYDLNIKNLDLEKYYNIINSEEINKYILLNDLIMIISFYRKKEYNKSIKEYIGGREDYLNNKEKLENYNLDVIYNIIISKITGVICEKNYKDKTHTPILMFNVSDWNGDISRVFLHEIGHIIDFNKFNSFDNSLEKTKSGKRKYEMFNETIVDIYADKAFDYLKENNIYLFEPFEITKLKDTNDNTSQEMKKIIKPLIENYNSYVIESRITGNSNILIDKIGLDNYEDLVNLLNELSNIKKVNIDEIKTKTNQIYENIEAKRYQK